ncbi:hypothetical protein MGU_11184 [Metarhizium guizhouense ARSEF 977]|uniref:Uncharacterized protein n=1 Tax=Metarhizium guizhouense (strain ARSEF 977) TaxID=1276136 RepID=A0A0B4GP03_METGA|nr:hypothetical protein MGU_11184 [Metarhizium guizhouense ARSEF 977]
MTFQAELQKVDQVRICLTTNPDLISAQALGLRKIIEVIKEGEMERRKHCQATRSRRKWVRTLLLIIYQHLGVEVLFLCSIALSITRLSETRNDENTFISKLGHWRRTARITRGICNLAKQHFAPYHEVLSQPAIPRTGVYIKQTRQGLDFENNTVNRVCPNSTALGPGVVPSYHGVRYLTPTTEKDVAGVDDIDDSGGSDKELAESPEGLQAANTGPASSTEVEDGKGRS